MSKTCESLHNSRSVWAAQSMSAPTERPSICFAKGQISLLSKHLLVSLHGSFQEPVVRSKEEEERGGEGATGLDHPRSKHRQTRQVGNFLGSFLTAYFPRVYFPKVYFSKLDPNTGRPIRLVTFLEKTHQVGSIRQFTQNFPDLQERKIRCE